MQLDALPSPGLIPNGQRLRQELTKAISYVEVVSDLTPAAQTSQAATLIECLEAAILAVTPYVVVEPDPEP